MLLGAAPSRLGRFCFEAVRDIAVTVWPVTSGADLVHGSEPRHPNRSPKPLAMNHVGGDWLVTSEAGGLNDQR